MFIYYFLYSLLFQSVHFLYHINNRFVSFFQTLYALLSRYKDRSQFTKQIVPTATLHYLCVCTHTDHLWSIQLRRGCSWHLIFVIFNRVNRIIFCMPLYFCVHVHTLLRLHTIITILRMSIEDVCDPTTLNFFFL